MVKYSIITFPGSNCDHDSYYIALKRNNKVNLIWHKDTDLQNPDIVILPGGFSYGDYLRCGIIARFSPIINEVVKFAQRGGLVLGICNGFQILTECGLLPGALMMNRDLKFICQHQYISVSNNKTPFTHLLIKGNTIDIPIAHKEGNYFIDNEGLKELEDNEQIVFQYSDKYGNISASFNPNGSIKNIAGIINKTGNVLGMMPHPERNAEDFSGSEDGSKIFASLEQSFLSSH
ncbi:MAG: phosphoribosylformylglycinamidine synthase subunit PurQ [Candidatus Cloacimonetes bacterium]|nr:phosphoribosylformylglycinamidine synthase subunit PurQ [Candidatus Cloacimonadota bacterium]